MVDLSVTNLCLAYGRKTVLEDVSLPAFAPGSMIGLLGPNGVGKSTLLRSLAGLESYRGDIRLDGEALRDLSHARRAGRIGYLPQTLPQGTSLAAYEAVISAYRAVRPDLPKAEIEAAVEDVFDLLGIRDIAFQALNKMSGGQRQMVGLAQVIVRRPAILLLDEPTSALDLRWQLNVLMVVRRIVEAQGGLCLMALHDINLALRHCDRIALFSDGRLLACGPAGQAMTSETLRQAYGVVGRVEQCSTGTPFVVTDGIASPADLAGTG
tara:strand:+ start:13216 stop:14016 length:801 start_codon:yes stop_codon:yes gene_type:complete